MGLVDKLKPFTNSGANEDAEGKVLQSLIDPKLKDLTTEINDPHAMAALEIVGEQLTVEGLPKSSKLLEKYVEKDKLNMIANKRKRAEEIIRGVGASRKSKRTLTEKLIGKNVDVDD